MTRKDFFFLSFMIIWASFVMILMVVSVFFEIIVLPPIFNTFVFSIIPVFILAIVAFLMGVNKKFNNWIFCDSKIWNWMIKKHSFYGLVNGVVGNYD